MRQLDDMNPPKVAGLSFWLIFALQTGFPLMWLIGYKGVGFPLLIIVYLFSVGVVRWKTTTYKFRVGAPEYDNELRKKQEKPWLYLFLLFGLFAPSTFEDILNGTAGDIYTRYLCIVAGVLFLALAMIESFRKVRFS